MAYENFRSDGVPLRGIGSAIKQALDQNQLHEHLRPHQALALWPEIAGEQIAGVCSAEAVRGGVLFVRAKSSVWANELTFYKPDLLERLNQRLGAVIIRDIHFSTGARSRSKSVQTAKPPVEVRGLSLPVQPAPPSVALDPQAKLAILVARTRSVLAWKRANGWEPCVRCGALQEPTAQSPARALGRPSGRRRKGTNSASGDGICPVCRALMGR